MSVERCASSAQERKPPPSLPTESAQKLTEPPANPGKAAAKSRSSVAPDADDWILLLDEDGKPRPVKNDVDFQEYLKWLEQKKQPPERPSYAFSDVTIEGTATDEEASVTVSLTVQITEEADWTLVPLELNEGSLRKFQHKYTPAAHVPRKANASGLAQFGEYDLRNGYRWWFRGAGEHVLTLDMQVRVRKISGVRRLQLAVPSAASSYLKLTLPIAKEQLSLEQITAGLQKTEAVGKQATVVEVIRLGQRLDLGWRALPDSRQVKTLLQAETKIRVEPTEESILLKAQQLVEPLQGSMKEFEVTLPTGFSVLELKVDGERYRTLDSFPQPPEPVKITLPAATTNRVQLDWLLQAPWPASGKLMVEGFNVSETPKQSDGMENVSQTLRQSGKIEIAAFDGYRIVKSSGTGVLRANDRELLGPAPISSAYQIQQQPFQLVLDLQKIVPSYSVRPQIFLKMGDKKIEMLADLELEVYRGVLQSLEIEWPRFEEQGWTIDRAELPGIVEMIETDAATGRMTFQFAKRISQGAPPLPLLLRATRNVDNTMAEAFPLTLPRVIASNPVRSVVVVTNQDNVESTVMPAQDTTTQPLSATLAEEVERLLSQPRMRDIRGKRQTGFLVRSDTHDFIVQLVTHPQSIHSETGVRVTLEDHQIEVHQHLLYDVEYEPVSQLRVMVPKSFPSDVQFTLGLVPLHFEWTGLELENSRQARLTLPEPRLNQFELLAHYTLPQTGKNLHGLDIPLVRSSDAKDVSGRLEFAADYPAELTVDDPGWANSPERDAADVWTTKNVGETLSIAWTPRTETDIQHLKISKSLVKSAVLANGQIYSQAYFQLDPEMDYVLISLPPDEMVPEAFHWDGVELDAKQVKEVQPDSGVFHLEIPPPAPALPADDSSPSENSHHRLLVEYHTKQSTALEWSQDFALPVPKFPGEVWIDKTIWEVTLPVDQQLFTLPEGFTPEFSWTRQGVFWQRTPNQSAGALESWLDLPASSESEPFAVEGNTYRFSYFGKPPALAFSSMNRSIVVLFGAGLALFAGVLLLKIPATRNVLTVLLAVFAFALCGIWYTAPMQLLLQPAALGLLLAIVAVLIDGSFKRQRQSAVVPLPSPNDYQAASTPPYAEPIGSEDPTAVRQFPEAKFGSSATQHRVSRSSSAGSSAPELIGSSITENPE